MRAGVLDRRITLQSRTVTQSDSGEEVVTWVDLATVWAQKVENRGAERFVAQQLVGKAVKTFRFRWSDAVEDVTVKDQLVHDGRSFDILDVREIGYREGIEVDVTGPNEEPIS